jgi:hypothetical protein
VSQALFGGIYAASVRLYYNLSHSTPQAAINPHEEEAALHLEFPGDIDPFFQQRSWFHTLGDGPHSEDFIRSHRPHPSSTTASAAKYRHHRRAPISLVGDVGFTSSFGDVDATYRTWSVALDPEQEP